MVDKVRCAHILLRTEQEAKDVLNQINKGVSFSKLAMEKSSCPSGKKGGDLGIFGRGRMVREFEKSVGELPDKDECVESG